MSSANLHQEPFPLVTFGFHETTLQSMPVSWQYHTSLSSPHPSLAQEFPMSILCRIVKNQKIFFVVLSLLYFCRHERKNHASYREDSPYAPTHIAHSHIGSLHTHLLALQDYPKILSAINLAGKSKPAIR